MTRFVARVLLTLPLLILAVSACSPSTVSTAALPTTIVRSTARVAAAPTTTLTSTPTSVPEPTPTPSPMPEVEDLPTNSGDQELDAAADDLNSLMNEVDELDDLGTELDGLTADFSLTF